MLLSLSRTRKEPCWLGGERRSCSASFRLILLKYQLKEKSRAVRGAKRWHMDGAASIPGTSAPSEQDLLLPTICSAQQPPSEWSRVCKRVSLLTPSSPGVAMFLQENVAFYCSLLATNHLLQQCLLTVALSWPGVSVFINENISGNCHLLLQTRQRWLGTLAALSQEGGLS